LHKLLTLPQSDKKLFSPGAFLELRMHKNVLATGLRLVPDPARALRKALR